VIRGLAALALTLGLAPGAAAAPAPYAFSTGTTDLKLAMASRPAAGATVGVAAADDFPLTRETRLSGATITGLLPSFASPSVIQRVVVEVYRIHPLDSDTGRTIAVPSRTGGPADVPTTTRDSADGGLVFDAAVLAQGVTALNSVVDGIHPLPNQTTGGEGSVSGEQVTLTLVFSPAPDLPAGDYFFVPRVGLSAPGADFLWLSAPKPIVGGGTPFASDRQAWIRDDDLAPDWLRVGRDIVGGGSGAPDYDAAFALSGAPVCPTLAIASTTPAGNVGAAYEGAFTVAGGAAPYAFAASGPLPPGLVLAPDGTVSGTPSQAGTFAFRVAASDAEGCTGSRDATLTVAAARPPPASGDAKPARLSALSIRPRAFRARAGARVRFTLDAAGRVRISAARRLAGRRAAHGRCAVPNRANRRHRRCRRVVTLAGGFTVKATAGRNVVRFRGRLAGHRLRRGRYRLVATPAGGAARTVPFRIR
jgi:Putative Ig domain